MNTFTGLVLLFLLDEQQEHFLDGQVSRSLSRKNAHVAIDPRQKPNEKLMTPLSSQNYEEFDSGLEEVSVS